MNYFLYIITTLIWSTTWLAIKFQLGEVSPAWSIAYRFALAALILLAFCLLTRRSLQLSYKQHLLLLLQGSLMFSGNYCLFYLASQYLMSGLVAVIFASLVVWNILHSRLFFKTPILPPVAVGALIGISGLIFVFWSQIKTLDLSSHDTHHTLLGLGLGVAATFFASWGNMLATYHQRKLKTPLIQSNALGMLYGTVVVVLIAIFCKEPPRFDWHFSYISSLLYLAFFGTVLAFGAYVSLLNRIGPERAAYSFVAIPILAVLISTLFEGFQWHLSAIIGIILVLIGNVMVLTKPKLRLRKAILETV